MATAPVTVTANLNFNPASLNAAGKQVQSAFGNINLPTKSVNAFNNSLGRITGQASEFDKSINAATARVFAFGAAVSIINGISTAFKSLVSSTIEVEKRLTEIGSILGGTAEQLGQFKNAIFDVAKNTGQTFATVADGASELARQGLSAEETVKRLNAALILTRVSGLDAEGSVNALTAAINGFASAGLSAEQIVNKLIAVDTAFAVSAKDLAEAFSRAGSTAEDAGVSFDELLGLVTSVQQTTARGGAVIGNAFKSIFSRLSRGTVIEDLKALGVEIDSSQTGVQKLQALSDALSKISNPTQANAIKELAGGVYQINVVSAALKDLSSETSIFARASQTAGQASNEAFEKNAQLNQTLASQINKLVQGLTELGSKIGELSIAPVIENLLTGANKLLDILNKVFDPEEGNKLIQGFFKGVGAFIAGPGLVLVSAAFFKLFQVVAKFAKEGISDLFKIGSEQERIKNIEGGIVALLQQDANLRAVLLSTSSTQAQKEQAVINAIKQQNALLTQQQALVNSIAVASAKAGVGGFTPSGGFTKGKGKTKFAAGFKEEEAMAKSLGASSSVKAKMGQGTIGGQKFIMNNQEVEIPNFAGGRDSAVIPLYARGFVPNFYGQIQKKPAKAIKKNINSLGDLTDDELKAYQSTGMEIGGKKYTAQQVQEALALKQKQRQLKKEKNKRITGTAEKRLDIKGDPYGFLVPFLGGTGQYTEQINQKLAIDKGKNAGVNFNLTDLDVRGPLLPAKELEGAKKRRLDISEKIKREVVKAAVSYSRPITSALGNPIVEKSGIEDLFAASGGRQGAYGALQGVIGSAFEAAVVAAVGGNEAAPEGPDFDVDAANKDIDTIFFGGQGKKLKYDFKVSNTADNVRSFASKIINDNIGYQNELKDFFANRAKNKKAKSAASGFIPNFAALNDAISREMAAGVPRDKIYIDQDNSLKSPFNREGIMVANTINEPNGGVQGIKRAKKEGQNPKTYGQNFVARGFVPNYAPLGAGKPQQAAPAQALGNLSSQVLQTSSKFQKMSVITSALSAAFYVVQGFLPDFAYSLKLDSEAVKKATKAKEDSTKALEEETKKGSKASQSVIDALNDKIKKFEDEIAALEGDAQAFSNTTQTVTNTLLGLGIFVPQIVSAFDKIKTSALALRLGGAAATAGGAAATAGTTLATAGTLTLTGIAAGGAVVIGTAVVAAIATGLASYAIGYLIQKPFVKAADEISRIPLDLQKVRSEIQSLQKIQIPNLEIETKRYREALWYIEKAFANGYKTIKLTATGLRSEFQKINDEAGVSGFDAKVQRSEGIDRLASGAKDIVTQQKLKKTRDPLEQQKIISERESVRISDSQNAGKRERAQAGQIIKAGQEDFLTGISKYLKTTSASTKDINTAVLQAQADTAEAKGPIDQNKIDKPLIDNVFTTGVDSLDRVDYSQRPGGGIISGSSRETIPQAPELDTNPTYRDKLDSFDLISGIETALGQQGNQTEIYDAIKRLTDSSENLKNSKFETDASGNIKSNQEANLKEFLNAEAALKPLLQKRVGSEEGGLEGLEQTFKTYKDAVLEGVKAQTQSFIKENEEREKINLDSLVKQKDVLDQFVDNFNATFLQNAERGATLIAEAFDSGSSSRINENINYLGGANLGTGKASGETFLRRQESLSQTISQLESSGFFENVGTANEQAKFRSDLAGQLLGGGQVTALQGALGAQSGALQKGSKTIADTQQNRSAIGGAAETAIKPILEQIKQAAIESGDSNLVQDVNRRISTLNDPRSNIEQIASAGNVNLEGTRLSDAAQTEFQKSLISATAGVQSVVNSLKGTPVATESENLGKQIEGVAAKLVTLQDALKVTVEDVTLPTVIKEFTTSTEGLTPIVEAFKTKISELETESSKRVELLKKYNEVEGGLLEIQKKYESTQKDLLGKIGSLVTNFGLASEKAKLFADNFPPPIPPQNTPGAAKTDPEPKEV